MINISRGCVHKFNDRSYLKYYNGRISDINNERGSVELGELLKSLTRRREECGWLDGDVEELYFWVSNIWNIRDDKHRSNIL